MLATAGGWLRKYVDSILQDGCTLMQVDSQHLKQVQHETAPLLSALPHNCCQGVNGYGAVVRLFPCLANTRGASLLSTWCSECA